MPTSKNIYAKSLKDKIIKQHVEAKSSYRDLQRQYDIQKDRINQWVSEATSQFKNPIEISQELKPKWKGILIADGEHIKARGQKGCWYTGVDLTSDIPNSIYRPEQENKFGWVLYFRGLSIMRYPLKWLISDGNTDILAASRRFYPMVRYQTCIEHYLRKTDRFLGYRKIIKQGRQQEFVAELKVRELIKLMLLSNSEPEFYGHWQKILYYPATNDLLRFFRRDIKRNLICLSAHFIDSQIPRTNNYAESLIKQFKRRIKNIEGFNSHQNAARYLQLLSIFLRFKPYTDAKKKNGKSRLQLADVDTSRMDWLDFGRK